MSALTNLPFSISDDLFSAVSNQTRTCAVCKETKTARRWYKDPQDPTACRCAACYQKTRGGVTRTCAICKETKTMKHHWYKDPQDPTAFRCDTCYKSARDGYTRTCVICKETKTEKNWYRDSQDRTAFRCGTCYMRAHYNSRKKRGLGLDEQPLSEKRNRSTPPSLPSEEEEWDLPLPESPGLFLPLLASPLPESDDPFGNLDGLL